MDTKWSYEKTKTYKNCRFAIINFDKNYLREELGLQWWVTGVANDEGAEDCTNTYYIMFRFVWSLTNFSFRIKSRKLTSTGTGNADGGGTSTNELGGGVDVTVGNRDGEWARINVKWWFLSNYFLPSGLNGQTAWGGKDDTVHNGEVIKVSEKEAKFNFFIFSLFFGSLVLYVCVWGESVFWERNAIWKPIG